MTDNASDRERSIRRLQQNLSSIRKIAGWTTEVLGDKIGVTKQTISNLENRKTQMSFTQYIAIRSVLDYEIEKNKENKVLSDVVKLLLDSGDKLDDDSYSKVQDVAKKTAASAVGGTPTSNLDDVFAPILMALGPVIGFIVGTLLTENVPSLWKKLLK